MKSVFEILKERWIEVGVIVALGLIRVFINRLPGFPYNFMPACISQAFFLVLVGVIMIVRAGFLRTAYLYGQERQKISRLVSTGKHFFWRLLIFSLIYAIILNGFYWGVMGVLRFCIGSSGFPGFTGWASRFCGLTVRIALMKPLLLVPAMIIVHDCGVIEGIKNVWAYKLFRAKGLLIFFAIQQLFKIVWMFGFFGNSKMLRYLSLAGNRVIWSLLVIMVSLSAVLFVAGQIPKEGLSEEVGIEE